MQTDEWPLAAEAADSSGDPARRARGLVEHARRAGSGRLATVRADFFLDPDQRLTEQERALMAALLDGLVSDLADELRAALPSHLAEAADSDNDRLVAALAGCGALDRGDLIALLLRRADEERIADAMRSRSPGENVSLVQLLVADGDSAVAEAAMALILARGRRRDRFGRLNLVFDDLPAEAAVALANAIAAALRPAIAALDPAGADRALQAAAAALLSRHDEGLRLDAHIAALVRSFEAAGRIDDMLLIAAADEGEIALVAHLLARRAAIAADDAWDMLIDSGGGRLARLLRMAECPRAVAAAVFAGPGRALGLADPATAIGDFDRIDPAEAASAAAWLRLDRAYRQAVSRMEGADGHFSIR